MKKFFKNLSFIFTLLTIFFSPIYILRFTVPFGDFYYPSTLLEMLIILTAVLTLVSRIFNKEKLRIFQTKFDGIILVIILTSLLAVITSYDLRGGFGIFRAYFLEPIIFYYSLVYQIKTRGNKLIILSLIASGLVLSIIAFLQKISGQFTLAPHEIAQGRVSALYNSANALALYLSPIIILALSYFTAEKNKLRKYLYLLFSLFGLLIIIWTKSRGGLIALFVAVLVFAYAVLTSKNEFLKKIWLIVPITICLLLSFFFYQLYFNYRYIPDEYGSNIIKTDTLQIRFLTWLGTTNLLRDHPLTGAGLDGYKELYSEKYKVNSYQEDFQYPHNFLLTVWVELGLLGVLGFTLLFLLLYKKLILNLNKNLYLNSGLLGVLTYLLIHGVVDVPYFKNDLSLEFWLFVSLIATLKLKENT